MNRRTDTDRLIRHKRLPELPNGHKAFSVRLRYCGRTDFYNAEYWDPFSRRWVIATHRPNLLTGLQAYGEMFVSVLLASRGFKN